MKTHPQCHILSEHCVPAFSSTRFFKVIHLVICSHEHKVQDHHMIQTQITHRKWAITFLKKIQINKNIIKINYGSIYNIAQLNTIHVTSPLYHLKFIFQSPITLYIINNSHALYNNYTKTQAYMKSGTMSVKNHPRALRST